MAKPKIETFKARVVTPDGNYLEIDSKGSVTAGMKTAFICLPPDRRRKLLDSLSKRHDNLLLREADHAKAPTDAAPGG